MNDRDSRSTSSSVADEDGVRVVAGDIRGRRTARLYQGVAVFLVACSAGYFLMPPQGANVRPPASPNPPASSMSAAVGDEESEQAAVPGQPPTPSRITTTSRRSLTPRREAAPRPEEPEPEGDRTLGLEHFVPPDQKPTAGELIEELHRRGIYEGIGAFPPPGTSPPMVGLAVPEDMELPEGYVRHHQVTDDGQPIEPILMYSPDYEFFDEDGRRVRIPDDRVVPPHLAPHGIPIREIEIPRNFDER